MGGEDGFGLQDVIIVTASMFCYMFRIHCFLNAFLADLSQPQLERFSPHWKYMKPLKSGEEENGKSLLKSGKENSKT